MRILIAEDDESLLDALLFDSRGWSDSVFAGAGEIDLLAARTYPDALAALACRPQIVLVDVCLALGSGIDVVCKSRELRPRPVCLAMSGKASAAQAFRLGELGVHAYLSKPFAPEELRAMLGAAWQAHTRARTLAWDAVQQPQSSPLHIVQNQIRLEMLKEALERTRWNYVASARLLGVTRQAVQQMVRRFALSRPLDGLSPQLRQGRSSRSAVGLSDRKSDGCVTVDG